MKTTTKDQMFPDYTNGWIEFSASVDDQTLQLSVTNWLREHIRGKWSCYNDNISNICWWRYKNESDAVYFRLTWLPY